MFYPVRPGNRGGRDLFKWDDDREQYLGVTVCAGYLDKGGKWRKGDWYTKDKDNLQEQQLIAEKMQAQQQDEKRIRQALGLEEREVIDEGPKLTKYEIEEITRKEQMEVDEDNPNGALGLGFKLNEKAIMNQKLSKDFNMNYNRLEGEGIINENNNNYKENKEQLSQQLQQNQPQQYENSQIIKKDKKKQKNEKKNNNYDNMTKEEKQKYQQELENSIKELKMRKQIKEQEKIKKQEKDKKNYKEKEHHHSRKKSRSRSRDHKHHHKRK